MWAISVLSKLKFNGLVYGLDFGLYHPDGVHYTLRTLVWLGNSPLEAAEQISNWYATHSAKHVTIDPTSILPENSPVWGLVKPRLLYPFLSVPFVGLFGISGMLVVPSLSLLITMFAIYRMATLRLKPFIATLFAISVSFSPTLIRWSVANLTDSISMALFSFVPLILHSRISIRTKYFSFFLLIIMTSLNRFCLPVWLGIGAYLLLRRNYRLAIFVFASSILAATQSIMQGSSVGLLPNENSDSLFQKVLLLPVSFLRIAIVELAQLAVLDRFLLVILVAAALNSIRNYKSINSQLFLLVAIAVWLLGAINGVIGVNFRYQLPLIPFVYWVIISSSLSSKINSALRDKS